MSDLNPAQKLAVEAPLGPLLMLAGAGAGKTHTLTERVLAMIQNGIASDRILCVTFTNKAAKEMRERLAKRLGIHLPETKRPWNIAGMPTMGTFHSLGALFLRRFAEHVGYSKNFTIADDDDQSKLIKTISKELKIDEKILAPRQIKFFISNWKNAGLSPQSAEAGANNSMESLAAKAYFEYAKRLKESDVMDFDDLLLLWLEIVKIEEVALWFHERFQAIFVDEYQDTNDVQYRIVKILAKKHRNLTVVGDDWQGIYSWRGANIKNIMSFQKDYPDAEIIKLEQNYRSTKTIIAAANSVIKKNPDALDKTLWTDNIEGALIHIVDAPDERGEAKIIIEKARNNPEDWAILYRTNAQSRILEEACKRAGIPYRIFWGQRFYDRKEVKDLISYLRIISNPRDLVALARIINVPSRKIGEKTLEQVIMTLREFNLWVNDLVDIIHEIDLGPAARVAVESFALWYQWVLRNAETLSLSAVIDHIITSVRYNDYLELEYGESEGAERAENLRELLSDAADYEGLVATESIGTFLEYVTLVTSSDTSTQAHALTMMTIHTSKGLEFPNVAIVGAEEGIFPNARTLMDPMGELLEERRLMYVAMTRAKNSLVITRSRTRTTYGSYQENMPSRFLKEIPTELVEFSSESSDLFGGSAYVLRAQSALPKSPLARPTPAPLRDTSGYSLGQRVEHPKFWVGTIVSLRDSIADIAFTGEGMKKLHLAHAELRKL